MKWRQGPDFHRTVLTRAYAKEHLIMEDKLYILSTLDYNGEPQSEVAFLDTTLNSSKWDRLPLVPYLEDCAMVSIHNKLLLVGGQYKQRKLGRFFLMSLQVVPHHVSLWDCTKKDTQKWQHPDIPIPGDGVTNCTATTYQHWLILVGCSMENYKHVLLKLKDCDTEQWYIQSISFLDIQGIFRSCLVRDRWYILSDSRDSYEYIHSISLPALIEHVTTSRPADTSSMWKTHRLPHPWFAPLCICDTLFLFGGAIPITNYRHVSVPTILQYQPETDEWVIAGYLPFLVRNCCCAMTSDGQIFIIHVGGHTNKDVVSHGQIILNI